MRLCLLKLMLQHSFLLQHSAYIVRSHQGPTARLTSNPDLLQEWNEMHHLQIMESLGGDSLWLDRFMAQHGAILYYWVHS